MQIRSLRMVAVASAFLCMLYSRRKFPRRTIQWNIWNIVLWWRYLYSPLQFQRRNIPSKPILDREHSCFLVFNMPLNMSEEERQPCILLEVESNVNHAGCNTGVIVGVYKPCSKCFKRTVYFKHCFISSSLWKASCQFIILPTCIQNKSKQTEKGNRDERFPLVF